MSNMRIYDAFRTTPPAALKEIKEGKLKGKSDINPMWRLEMLTKQFGPCGTGWKYEVTRIDHLGVPERSEVMCFVDINLFYKDGDKWSEPVFGTGGSMLVENFRNAGVKSNDDGYKMALTDAISVACKQLGMSADVYWAAGETKYNKPAPEPTPTPKPVPAQQKRSERVTGLCQHHEISYDTFTEFLTDLQLDGKVANTPVDAMTDAEFVQMLGVMHETLNATKAS